MGGNRKDAGILPLREDIEADVCIKGKSGPPLANLFSGRKKEGKFSGDLSEGTIMAEILSGDLMGKSLADLVQLIKSGEAYVNVHTDAKPD